MTAPSFDDFFQGEARKHLLRAIDAALLEDGPDLTSNAVFSAGDTLHAVIVAKEETLLAGLPALPLALERAAALEPGEYYAETAAKEGDLLPRGAEVARIRGSARIILRAERVILNFITHLSGIANQTRAYVNALEGTGVQLLDTRKTLPGLRYPEKYAVLVGGGRNHRKNLAELLMLKDNHIDAAGGITDAVARLRAAYSPCPPVEVECRTLAEVAEAAACNVERIMLDNMGPDELPEALALIPAHVEAEISGGVTLESIRSLALRYAGREKAYISVGRITHSAPAADFSMRIFSG